MCIFVPVGLVGDLGKPLVEGVVADLLEVFDPWCDCWVNTFGLQWVVLVPSTAITERRHTAMSANPKSFPPMVRVMRSTFLPASFATWPSMSSSTSPEHAVKSKLEGMSMKGLSLRSCDGYEPS